MPHRMFAVESFINNKSGTSEHHFFRQRFIIGGEEKETLKYEL